jgi:hypothetical protein
VKIAFAGDLAKLVVWVRLSRSKQFNRLPLQIRSRRLLLKHTLLDSLRQSLNLNVLIPQLMLKLSLFAGNSSELTL